MAKLLIRKDGKFLEAELEEDHEYPVTTENVIEPSDLCHFGSEIHTGFDSMEFSGLSLYYQGALNKAEKLGAEYVLPSEIRGTSKRSELHPAWHLEGTITFYVRK